MHFVIADVAHVGPLFRIVDLWQTCRATASCVWQLSEYEIGHTAHAAVNDARTAAAHMQFVSGPYVYMCSGGLLNDTGNSGRNYFLTANHCVSKGGEASSLETFFFYTDCAKEVLIPPGTVGSQILSGSRTSDFTLLELNGAVPLGTSRLGWTTDTVARNKDEPMHEPMLYRISHPNGAPQSYSEHKVDTRAPTCRSWPRGSWIYSRDTLGATMGGSSSQNTSYPYSTAGTYTVSLTVTDNAGASDSHETSVTVTDDSRANDDITVASLATSVDCARGGRWTAHVDIEISPAISGASVSGSWGGSATFEVTDIQYPGYTFLPGNHAIGIHNTCSSP
jgi:hypothetical protein